MREDTLKRLDLIMANLKVLEPSPDFDFEFRRRLGEASSRAREELPLIRAIKLAVEKIRYILVPETPALVRVAASFAVIFSIGIYIYGTQPLSPTSLSSVGSVTILTAHGAYPSENAGGVVLKAGDIVTTGPAGQVDIALPGKYTVRIKENSNFTIAKLTPRMGHGTAAFKLSGGRTLIDIEKGFKGSKFVIDTGAGSAVALGTKFSVDVAGNKTDVAVVEGKVKVSGKRRPTKMLLAKNTVYVGPGQRTEVSIGGFPNPPEMIMADEWSRLEELYQIGKKPQIVLLIKNTPGRVMELLAPCAIYVSDEKPRTIPQDFETAVRKIDEAIKSGYASKHLDAVKLLEKIAVFHPDPKYSPQLLLYVGSYYEFILRHEDAIRSFQRVALEYQGSSFASLAQTAIGIIYDERLKDETKAIEAFEKVLKNYPNSIDAVFVREKLGMKKSENNIKN